MYYLDPDSDSAGQKSPDPIGSGSSAPRPIHHPESRDKTWFKASVSRIRIFKVRFRMNPFGQTRTRFLYPDLPLGLEQLSLLNSEKSNLLFLFWSYCCTFLWVNFTFQTSTFKSLKCLLDWQTGIIGAVERKYQVGLKDYWERIEWLARLKWINVLTKSRGLQNLWFYPAP